MKKLFSFFMFLGVLQVVPAQEMMILKNSGKVVIGDTSAVKTEGNFSLYVQHGVLTERVKVALTSSGEWKDDAFERTPSLHQVAKSIEENSHLYSMPSADDLVKSGYELKEMDAKLLEQIEWLWQYTLQMSAENQAMKKEIAELKAMLEKDK